MKKILFPATAQLHLARQTLLLEELRKDFEVDIFEPETKNEGGMDAFAIFCAVEFRNALTKKAYDCVLVRGDRFEMLPIAMTAAYRGIKVVQLEAGDLSGVIDNRVRHAITHLSDFHFVTNEEARVRIIQMGMPLKNIWNYGALDCEFAAMVPVKKLREKPYLLSTYHPIKGEDENEVTKAIEFFKKDFDIIEIASNKDYGRQYGQERYSPEDFINLMRFASCCIGNSSSLLKEASIIGASVVNIGNRQQKRLKPKNVLDVVCVADRIKSGIEYQLKNNYESDFTYFNPNTSGLIAQKLKEVL